MPSRSPPKNCSGVRGSPPSKTTSSSQSAGTAQSGVGRVVGRGRAGEPVGEDLVDDRVARPVRRRRRAS